MAVPAIIPQRRESPWKHINSLAQTFADVQDKSKLDDLVKGASGGDRNKLIALYAKDPQAARGIHALQSEDKATKQKDFQDFAGGALAYIVEAKPEEKQQRFTQARALLAQKFPEMAAEIPEQYDPLWERQMVMNFANQEGNLGKNWQALAAKAGYLPQSTNEYAPSFKTQEITLPDGRMQLAVFDARTGQLMPQGEPYAASMGTESRPAATIQEIEYLNQIRAGKVPGVTEADYWRNKSATQIINAGDRQIAYDRAGNVVDEFAVGQKQAPATLGVTPNAPPDVQAQEAAKAAALQAGATEGAKQQKQLEYAGPQKAAVEQASVDVEKRARLPKAQASLQTIVDSSNRVSQEIQEALHLVNRGTAGPGAILANIPGTEARDLRAKIATIKANIGFDALQEMRANSPTGGALGQVAVQEIEYLQAVLGNLDQAQSVDQLKSALQQVGQQIQSRNQRYQAAFMQDFGQGQQAPQVNNMQQAPASPPANPNQFNLPGNNVPAGPNVIGSGKSVSAARLQGLVTEANKKGINVTLEQMRQRLLDAGYMIR